jgi:hypothetical protein
MEISASPFVSALADATHPAQKSDAHAQALRTAIANLASGSTTGQVQTETALLRTLLQALQSTPGTKGQIGPLLADLAKAQVLPATPPAIRNEIARTLEIAQPLRDLPDDTELARVLLSSRTPPNTTTGASPAPDTTRQGALVADLKSALTSLQGALQQWATKEGATPTATAPAPQQMAVATTSALASGSAAPKQGLGALPTPASPNPTGPNPTGPNPSGPNPSGTSAPSSLQGATKETGTVQGGALTPANLQPPLVVPLGSLATLPSPANPGISSAHGGMADAMVSFLLSQQAAATPSDVMMRQRNARLANPGDGRSDLSPGATNPAVAAYRKALPPTPAQPATLWPHEPGPAFIARTLSARTEAALTQVKILEITAQLQRAEQSTANAQVAPEPRWTFDLPLQTPFGQAQARFEVSRDSFKARNGAQAVVWRTRFSMDVEPLGPVHAQIALLGKHAWIGLWAERPEAMNLLEQQQAELQNTFSADNLEAEVICCLGSPPAHAAGTGTMWDNAV